MDERQTILIAWEWMLCLIYTSVYQARRPFGMYIVFIFGTLHLIAIFVNQYVKTTDPIRARLVIYLLSFVLIVTPFTFILRSMVYLIEFVRLPPTKWTTAVTAILFITWCVLILFCLMFVQLGYLITYGVLITIVMVLLFEQSGEWVIVAISEVGLFWCIIFPLFIMDKKYEANWLLIISCIPKTVLLCVENYNWIESKFISTNKVTWIDHILFSFHRILLTTVIGTLMILGSFAIYLVVVMGATESELAVHRAFNYVF